MPRPNRKLNDHSNVTVSARFLRTTTAKTLLEGQYDFGAPLLSFKGRTVAQSVTNDQRTVFDVVLDVLPNEIYQLAPTSIKYVSEIPLEEASETLMNEAPLVEADSNGGVVPDVDSDSDDDFLDDALQSGDGPDALDEDEEDSTINNENWRRREVYVDNRVNSATGFVHIKARIFIDDPLNASPMKFFFRFLPLNHIQFYVIPCINSHAHEVTATWNDLTYFEYLTWIGLMLYMMVWRNNDTKAYWRKSGIRSQLSINFDDYMAYTRFKEITAMHVFMVPDGAQ